MSRTMVEQLIGADREPFPFPFSIFPDGPFPPHRSADEWQQNWDRVCENATATKQVEALHAARDEYEAALQAQIRILKDTLFLAEFGHRSGENGSPRTEPWRTAAENLQRFHDELFGRWKTLDDLYRILIEKFSLPAAELKRLAAMYPPPQSWFDEDLDDIFADDKGES
jgi:hypothetical protein